MNACQLFKVIEHKENDNSRTAACDLSWFIINIFFPLQPWFLTHSSQNPWNFLSSRSNESIFCYNICLFVLSWNCFRVLKVKWVSHYSSQAHFSHSWVSVNEMAFGNPLKLEGWLPRGLKHVIRGLELSVPLLTSNGEWINYQWSVTINYVCRMEPPQKNLKGSKFAG